MYSLISIRTMFFSSSNNACASALASSCFAYAGRTQEEERPDRTVPDLRIPARRNAGSHRKPSQPLHPDRSRAHAMISSRCKQLRTRSPSISLETGMPVQRATMRAISSSRYRVAQQRAVALGDFGPSLPASCQLFLQLRQYDRTCSSAASGPGRTDSAPARNLTAHCLQSADAKLLHSAQSSCFSVSQRACIRVQTVRAVSRQLFLNDTQAFAGELRLSSFFSAASSICVLHDATANVHPIPVGMDSISARSGRTRFIDQIDGLVRQETIGDVTVGQRRSGDRSPDRGFSPRDKTS